MAYARQNNRFISPDMCGSSVGYYMRIEECKYKDEPTKYTLYATVVMADCNHKIDWSFSENEGGVEKIDAAIDMFKEFRKFYIEAEKLTAKLNK